MAEALSPEEQIMALRRELAERDAIIAAREAELAEAAIVKAKLTAALLEIEQIKMQLATLRRQRYGRSSEKLDNDIAQLEMRLEDCEEDVGEHLAARPELDRHSAPRPRGKSGRKPLPPHLPREVVVHEPEILCNCGNCDPARLARLGELITEVLEKIPARLKVIRHVRPKYACRLCEKIFQAPVPELPIEKGRPGPGLLAHIAISKYCDGLPLYRQSGILAREGVEIDRTTMAEWMGHVAWWLRPLAALISDYVMAQSVILDRRHADPHIGTRNRKDQAVALLVLCDRPAAIPRAWPSSGALSLQP
jgi:transposase